MKSLEWAEPASVYIVGYNLGVVNALTVPTTYFSCMAASPPKTLDLGYLTMTAAN